MSDRFDFVVRRETIESTLRASIRMLSPDTKRYSVWTNACDQLQCPRSKLRSNRAKSFMESTFAVDRAQYAAPPPRESASMTSYWGFPNGYDAQWTPVWTTYYSMAGRRPARADRPSRAGFQSILTSSSQYVLRGDQSGRYSIWGSGSDVTGQKNPSHHL